MSDDSAPQLAEAIQNLINSKPYSPTKDELVKVIRDHVDQELQKALGGLPEPFIYNTGGVTAAPSIVGGVWTCSNVLALGPPRYEALPHEHSWAQLGPAILIDLVMDEYVVSELCFCGKHRNRTVAGMELLQK